MTTVAWLVALVFAGLVVAGFVLVVLGVRERAVLSTPRCAKCGYDVRGQAMTAEGVGMCPECGSDLRGEGAVSFGTYRRRPRLVLVGVGLMLLPVVAVPAMKMVGSRSVAVVGGPRVGPTAVAGMGNAQLIGALAGAMNSPWEWQELERRKGDGRLSKQEVDQAVVALIGALEARRERGQRQEPLHWAGRFVEGVIADGDVSKGRVAELMKAFYGDAPRFECRDKVREGEPLVVDVRSDAPWNMGQNRLVYALGPVVADGGITLPVAPGYGGRTTSHPDQFSGMGHFNTRIAVGHGLAPGRHEVQFACDMGVVAEGALLRGVDGKPGTPEKWPTPVARWRATTRRVVEVVPAGVAVVDVVTDPAMDPYGSYVLGVEQVAVRPASQGVELVIKWRGSGSPGMALAYRVVARPAGGGKEIDFGSYVANVTDGGGTITATTTTGSKRLAGLSGEVRVVDLVLVPDAKVAEGYPGIEKIWGGEKVIRGVKVERFDLEGSGGAN